ncbi:hypothetical protein Z948_452 [Sulfitobacter donghicola DSW-25 = KCTC 12864 = JCM 14565]|nr:hypothetical protein Z948_452 [Sulfitobacter donghicola DSW-25 = KCTC 12864 = JCM 14565]
MKDIRMAPENGVRHAPYRKALRYESPQSLNAAIMRLRRGV